MSTNGVELNGIHVALAKLVESTSIAVATAGPPSTVAKVILLFTKPFRKLKDMPPASATAGSVLAARKNPPCDTGNDKIKLVWPFVP